MENEFYQPDIFDISQEEKEELFKQVKSLREKFSKESFLNMTLSEQKIFIQYARAFRKEKFQLHKKQADEQKSKRVRSNEPKEKKLGIRFLKKEIERLQDKSILEDLSSEEEENLKKYKEMAYQIHLEKLANLS